MVDINKLNMLSVTTNLLIMSASNVHALEPKEECSSWSLDGPQEKGKPSIKYKVAPSQSRRHPEDFTMIPGSSSVCKMSPYCAIENVEQKTELNNGTSKNSEESWESGESGESQ